MLTRVGVAFGVVLVVGVVALGAWQHSSPERGAGGGGAVRLRACARGQLRHV
jgi:hypothetical protein